jgi:hypothetical protein
MASGHDSDSSVASSSPKGKGKGRAKKKNDDDSNYLDPQTPIDKPRDAFGAFLDQSMQMGLDELVDSNGVTFTIGTMCSGTDAPVLALREFQDAAVANGHPNLINATHTYSVEIESCKQGFIATNAKPEGEIFRDVVEVSDPDKSEA